jgi:putative radical SAM enzyme (TIGR03279 family)
MVRIADISPGTIAAELALEIGSRVVRINGAPVRDTIDFRFLETDGFLELELASACGGENVIYEIEKDAGESLGIVPAADSVRQCANKCVFCFIDGNPANARRSLHLKDDDFRLSFTYGSYVTLTNLGPKGFERLIEQRLSPLYVSVHATEPDVRRRLLGVDRGGEIVAQLRELTHAGIDVHTQIVLCPEWNDGEHLVRTIDDLWSLGPHVLSVSVVPVGLTTYNLGRPVHLLTREEAARALAQIDDARARSLDERGTGWAYAGDEMFFIAEHALPGSAYYDDWPLTENGVGAVRRLIDDAAAGTAELPRRSGRFAIVTGTRLAPVVASIAERMAQHSGAHIEVLGVENRMFGATVTTAGLLPGADMRDALLAAGPFDGIMLPAEALNDDGRFIDNLTFDALAAAVAPAALVAGHELTETMKRL